jgi:hypothetical protein
VQLDTNVQLAVTLPHFDGPFDLLLNLIRKNEYPMEKLPIPAITGQFRTKSRSLPLSSLRLRRLLPPAAACCWLSWRLAAPERYCCIRAGRRTTKGANRRLSTPLQFEFALRRDYPFPFGMFATRILNPCCCE